MFKTIHECGLELVAATQGYSKDWDEDGFMLDDMMPVRAARASFGKQDKTGQNVEADIKLMKFLAEHQHLTPFEYQHATFLIECPLFIRSQIHRHRTFSFNEISRRYTSENLEFWIPDKFRKQSTSNKQASTDEEIDSSNFTLSLGWEKDSDGIPQPKGESNGNNGFDEYKWTCYNSWLTYKDFVEKTGVCREQARALLPQALITRFYMGGNLRNWAHFIHLRKDAHAQYEVQVIANRIAEELRKLWPESCLAMGI